MDPLQVLWMPVGATMPMLGSRTLVDVTDGDTPNVRMPIRMLSVDTPESTAGSEEGAGRVDGRFAELATWIRDGRAPIERGLADYLLPRLDTGAAGTLQWTQAQAAKAFLAAQIERRLARPPGQPPRTLFIRTADAPFDDNHRLLAYIAPNYSERERATLTREQRATFNLDLVESGWAAPFVIYPSVPGERDLPLLVGKALDAMSAGRGIWADDATLLAYEYRMCEKLHRVTRRIVEGQVLDAAERASWRERYVADMRSRALFGPEAYPRVPPAYRLWIWPADVRAAIAALSLVPTVHA